MEQQATEVTAHYVPGHFNRNANTTIPGYWTPDNTEQRIPCATKKEAIAAGEQWAKDFPESDDDWN